MATYAIGDIQGCYSQLKALLKKVQFSPNCDQLWLVGDIVNRGPQSLETLQAIYDLSDNIQCVLGNHDLHLIACAYNARQPSKKDTITPILEHKDCDTLINWLIQRPLLIDDPELGFSMTHAGIPHIWSLEQAKSFANQAMSMFRKSVPTNIKALFSNSPDTWNDNLSPLQQCISSLNYFTRMRLISAKGRLNFEHKGPPLNQNGSNEYSSQWTAWFKLDSPACAKRNILFGHWAALNGITDNHKIHALDTGCVWGGTLTALRLEDLQRFHVS